MDAQRFDEFTRELATAASRRRVLLGLLVGGVGTLFGRFISTVQAQGACTSTSDCAGDGDPCTAVECLNGQCIHSPVICDAGYVCVDAECVPESGATESCSSTSDCAGDGDPCTAVECVSGQCVHTPVVCEDGCHCIEAECICEEGPNNETETQSGRDQIDASEREIYISPTFHYVITWLAEKWREVEKSSVDHVDMLVLENNSSTITLEAFEGFEGDIEACLADAAGELENSDRIQEIKPAVFETGEPVETFEERIASRTYLTVDSEVQTASGYTVWEISCFTLIKHRAVLRVTYTVPGEEYPELGTPLLRSIQLPRAAFDSDLGDHTGSDNCSRESVGLGTDPPTPLLNDDGNEIGVAAYLGSSPDGWGNLVVFENSGTESLALDLRHLYGEAFESDEQYWPVSTEWVAGGQGDSSTKLTLPVGDVAVARVTFKEGEEPEDFFYSEGERDPTLIFSMGGDCAGGRPRIRLSF